MIPGPRDDGNADFVREGARVRNDPLQVLRHLRHLQSMEVNGQASAHHHRPSPPLLHESLHRVLPVVRLEDLRARLAVDGPVLLVLVAQLSFTLASHAHRLLRGGEELAVAPRLLRPLHVQDARVGQTVRRLPTLAQHLQVVH